MTMTSPKANSQGNSPKPKYDPDEIWDSAVVRGIEEGIRRRKEWEAREQASRQAEPKDR